MRITFVLPLATVSGGVRVVATYARLLVARGHEVTVVSLPKRRLPLWRRVQDLVRHRGAPRKVKVTTSLLDFLGPRHIVLDRPRPVTEADVPDADVIVATWWSTAEWVAALPARKGAGLYLLQDYEVFPGQPVDRVAATYRLPLRKLAVSSYIREEIARNHGAGEIALLPNAVDLDIFSAPPRDRGTPLTVGFLYTGKLRKRADLAIEAVTQARALLPDLRIVILTAKPIDPDIALPPGTQVHVNPPPGEIPALYAACDLWLFTSASEGFGLPILEAMACRTPVLATRAGAAEDLIDGGNGTLLEDDAAAFAREIRRIAHLPPQDWAAMSEAAHETAHRYTWDDATDLLVAHCEDESAQAKGSRTVDFPTLRG